MRNSITAAIGNVIAVALLSVGSAQASQPINETRSIEPGGRVVVENVRGHIRVEATDRTDVAITGSLGEGVIGLQISGDAQHLSIKVEYPDSDGGWFSNWRSKAEGSDLRVQVPASVTLDVSSVSAHIEATGIAGQHVEIESVSGKVDYAGTAAELEIETVSGAIDVDGSANNVSLQTVSGALQVQAAVTERLTAESVSGDIGVDNPTPLRRLQVSTVSGDLLLKAGTAAGARFDIESLSGGVQLQLAPSTSARLRAETFSGDLDSDVGKIEREEYGPGARLDAQLADGDGDIRVESFSGGLRIRAN